MSTNSCWLTDQLSHGMCQTNADNIYGKQVEDGGSMWHLGCRSLLGTCEGDAIRLNFHCRRKIHRCGDLQRWERCPNGIPTISWTIRAATEQGVRAWACRKKSVESFDYAWHCLTAGFAQLENSTGYTGSTVRCCQRTNCPPFYPWTLPKTLRCSACWSCLAPNFGGSQASCHT